MALIKCPECGRDRISDMSQTCPDCGFQIKAYFEQESEREKANRYNIERESIMQNEFDNLKPELENKLKEIDDLLYPEKPAFFRGLFDKDGRKLVLIVIITTVILCCLGFVSKLFIFLLSIWLVVGIPFFSFLYYTDYRSDMLDYRDKTSNWEQYKENKKQEILNYYESVAYRNFKSKIPRIYEHLDICPICGNIGISEWHGRTMCDKCKNYIIPLISLYRRAYYREMSIKLNKDSWQIIRDEVSENYQFNPGTMAHNAESAYLEKQSTNEAILNDMILNHTNEKSVKCPVCGSSNIFGISTLNRAISVSAFGLASSKIGKQYECKNCKHKW